METTAELDDIATDRCDSCGREFFKKALNYGPNPFSSDVYGDETPCVLCNQCYGEACDDI